MNLDSIRGEMAEQIEAEGWVQPYIAQGLLAEVERLQHWLETLVHLGSFAHNGACILCHEAPCRDDCDVGQAVDYIAALEQEGE